MIMEQLMDFFSDVNFSNHDRVMEVLQEEGVSQSLLARCARYYSCQSCPSSQALNTWWKENFRVSRLTFDYICRAVGPVIRRQDTILRAAIPVETRAAVGLWRLATGDSYRSCGLMFGIAKSTAIGVCQDFV